VTHTAPCRWSADGARFRLRNEFFREDGQLAARVTSIGGWLDLTQRKLVAPPPRLAQLLRALVRSEDYTEIS
jgi:acyl-CoA thioester hydrolase